jgi:N,N'-diacetyllegionaminate synthase
MPQTIIIAEAGVNHNGDMAIAKQLIDAAAWAGAHMVKFQTFVTEELVHINAPKANYQKKETDVNESQYDMLKRLELSKQNHIDLIAYCHTKNIQFLSTPFDLPSIDLLAELGLNWIKIPSGEVNNIPYLRHMAGRFKHYLLSTGMSPMTEIQLALDTLISAGVEKKQVTVLHCNTEYPTAMQDVNLLAMQTIAKQLQVAVGYSDHTIGNQVAIAAVALGAVVIEKHFTLDKTMPGPDHKASLEPAELQQLVHNIQQIEIALGSAQKLVSASAMNNALVAKKSIVAKTIIEAGSFFTEHNLTVKRPGTGISASQWDNVIGTKATRNFAPNEMITLS